MNMKIKSQLIAIVMLGIMIGYTFLYGGHFSQTQDEPNLLTTDNRLGVMSGAEHEVWNTMRENIRAKAYPEVNALIGFSKSDIDFSVIPAKETFLTDEAVLAELRIRNVSDKTLHVNEPRPMRMSTDSAPYKGYYQDIYLVTVDPLESTWMKTLLPGQKVSIPVLLPTTNCGANKAFFSLSVLKFSGKGASGSDGPVPNLGTAACSFNVTPKETYKPTNPQ